MTTPLQRLDDAIHTFLTECEDERTISGWVLGISTTRIDASDGELLPLVSGQQYALGPQTTVTDATGLARYLSVILENHMVSGTTSDE